MNKKQKREAAKAEKAATVKTAEKAAPVAKVAKVAKPVKEGGLPKLPKLPSASRARKPKPFVDCACGCETPTRATWAPGHDARAKGWALRVERGIVKLADVPENEQKGAKHFLKLHKDLGTTADKITIVKGKKTAKPEPVEEAAAVEEAVEGETVAGDAVNE